MTKYDNIKYYYDKYKNADGLIGDCGEAWSVDSKTNLSYYQLLYALLIPRKGGFFIIKMFAANFNDYYLAALRVIRSYYKKILIYKSNINFWSPEIYFIGKGFKGITEQEKDIIFDNIRNNKYMIGNVDYKFLGSYDNLMTNILNDHIESKKLLMFIADNKEKYDKLYPQICDIVRNKNVKYAKSYLTHLNKIAHLLDIFRNKNMIEHITDK